jgi:hypothetical protein
MNTEPARMTFAALRAMPRADLEAMPPTRPTVKPGSETPVKVRSQVEPEPETDPTMTIQKSDWVERLVREWGLGTQPPLRRRFFERVAELLVAHGDRCLRLVSAARMQAHGKDRPAIYFCRALSIKIAEAGLLPGGEVLRGW